MKRICILSALFLLLASGLMGRSIMNVMAEEPAAPAPVRYYTSIEICPGDSLWSIAEQYCAGGDLTTTAYVEVLKNMNSLASDTIHSGQHLTVMYFVPAE